MGNCKNITFNGITSDVRKYWPECGDEDATLIANTMILFLSQRRRYTHSKPIKGKKLLSMIRTTKL